MLMNFNDTIGNRTHDLPTCNAVPQPTALPRAPDRNQARPQLETSKICLKARNKKYKPYHRLCDKLNNKETEQVATKAVKCSKT
jgi:hypothetical protein